MPRHGFTDTAPESIDMALQLPLAPIYATGWRAALRTAPMTRAVTAHAEHTTSAVPSLKLAVIVAASRSHDWHMVGSLALPQVDPLPSQSGEMDSLIRAGHGRCDREVTCSLSVTPGGSPSSVVLW